VSGRARAVSAARKERGAGKGPSAVLTCGCVTRESKKAPRQERGGCRGGCFANQLRPDSRVLRRLMPRQNDDSTRRCTIFLRGLTAGRCPLRHHLAPLRSSPARVSSTSKYFFLLSQKPRFHRHFLLLVQRSAKIFRTAERLRGVRCRQRKAAADNAVGGGAYTQN